MFCLLLTGHMIENYILGFFYLISILVAFLFIIHIIKIAENQLFNNT